MEVQQDQLCSECQGNGFVPQPRGLGVMRCQKCLEREVHRQRQAYVEQHFWRFREAGLGNYKPETPQQRKAVKALKERPEGGYAFVGVPQRGKTHLLVAQYRMAGVKYRCELRSSMQLIAELQQVQVDEEARSPILEALQERRLRLLWDDIDKVSFDKSSFRVEMVFELIDEIWRMELPLSVTSNVPIRELQEVGGLSPAAARRLMDLCLEVPL